MKKCIIAIAPIYILLFVLFWILKGFVFALVTMSIIIVLAAAFVAWVEFVSNHFDDD